MLALPNNPVYWSLCLFLVPSVVIGSVADAKPPRASVITAVTVIRGIIPPV